MVKNQLSIYHRAFKSFLKELQSAKADRKLQEALLANQQEHRAYLAKLKKAESEPKLREAIIGGYKGQERLDAKRSTCEVDTDWIETIEFALPYLEKAIMENRQFILQNGNTVLIEQAKRISKSSVEHLAHHSELITHEAKPGEDMIPDKIYVVENTDNYAVYENRFLYMLLLNLQDFVDSRYSAIVKTWNSFASELVMDKTVRFGKRTMEYSITLRENAENDETTSYDAKTSEILGRIRRIQQQVTMLMTTPLMKDVSRAPLLKPPITRTNVLRMDTNFREAVALYDFLTEYHKDGYTVQEYHQTMEPFSLEALEDFSEILAGLSYLTYRYGGNIQDEMEQDYLAEELIMKELRDKEIVAHLAQLKKELSASGKSLDEYLLALEQRNVVLEKERIEQRVFEKQLYERDNTIQQQNKQCRKLELSVSELENEVVQQEAIQKRREAQFNQEMDLMKEAHRCEIEEKEEQIDQLNEKMDILNARLLGIRQEHGLITAEDDYSSKEGFAELQREYGAFRRFFDAQWKQAKKSIRKKAIWSGIAVAKDKSDSDKSTKSADDK